ncbi:serine hydrolase [Rhizobium jaguaris]|uniref:serine hydrolase domain-containing protein n=1 Tax=Rhizobium jaguaris TaxID=1312183 RepID=UPI0039BF0C38
MQFPDDEWQVDGSGYDAELLEDALQAASDFGAISAAIVHRGKVLAWRGDPKQKVLIRSVRKSLLSALIGIEVKEGRIDLGATLKDLDIDDVEPALTDAEKQATVRDLIMARSGIYHPALAESAEMKAARPARGSHPVGTFWYYNNWDFNALGTIYERASGHSVFEGFQRYIAGPIGMRDFRLDDCAFLRGEDSIHSAYHIHLTLRDMARFGHLYLNEGNWKGHQIVPREWVLESVTAHSVMPAIGGYGYMWWTTGPDGKAQREGSTIAAQLPAFRYFAHGHHGQMIAVMPEKQLVLATLATSKTKTQADWARLSDFMLSASKAIS